MESEQMMQAAQKMQNAATMMIHCLELASELEGMKAENSLRKTRNEVQAYCEADFMRLSNQLHDFRQSWSGW